MLASLTYALNLCHKSGHLDSIPKFNDLLIGPPLRVILKKYLKTNNEELVKNVEQKFITHYDSKSFLMVKPFEGVDLLLKTLKFADVQLFIVTNKRSHATMKIIENLDWRGYFHGISCLDNYPKCSNKAEILSRLSNINNGVRQCIYVGDTKEDFEAANFSKMYFIGVCWGYGQEGQLGPHVAVSTNDVINFIFQKNL